MLLSHVAVAPDYSFANGNHPPHAASQPPRQTSNYAPMAGLTQYFQQAASFITGEPSTGGTLNHSSSDPDINHTYQIQQSGAVNYQTPQMNHAASVPNNLYAHPNTMYNGSYNDPNSTSSCPPTPQAMRGGPLVAPTGPVAPIAPVVSVAPVIPVAPVILATNNIPQPPAVGLPNAQPAASAQVLHSGPYNGSGTPPMPKHTHVQSVVSQAVVVAQMSTPTMLGAKPAASNSPVISRQPLVTPQAYGVQSVTNFQVQPRVSSAPAVITPHDITQSAAPVPPNPQPISTVISEQSSDYQSMNGYYSDNNQSNIAPYFQPVPQLSSLPPMPTNNYEPQIENASFLRSTSMPGLPPQPRVSPTPALAGPPPVDGYYLRKLSSQSSPNQSGQNSPVPNSDSCTSPLPKSEVGSSDLAVQQLKACRDCCTTKLNNRTLDDISKRISCFKQMWDSGKLSDPVKMMMMQLTAGKIYSFAYFSNKPEAGPNF